MNTHTQLSKSWTGQFVTFTVATVAAAPLANTEKPVGSFQAASAYEASTTQLKGFVHQENEFFISESESKDLLARLDSDSPVTRLPENISEEAFLAFIQS